MSEPTAQQLIIRRLGCSEFQTTWDAMRTYTAARNADSPDEIWLLEHPPVYTLGLNGKPEHLIDPGEIPVLSCDRGGQVTYHGPGQLIIYLLLDLQRLNLGVKALVADIEQATINMLDQLEISAQRREGAPGVYVDGAKIAALGMRVKGGCTYHGLSFNCDMDLAPFQGINPCGMAGLRSTQLSHYHVVDQQVVQQRLLKCLLEQIYHRRGHLTEQHATTTLNVDGNLPNILTDAPDWVHWIAQDADGAWWGFEVEPLLYDHGWYENEIGRYVHLASGEVRLDWRDSLRNRKRNQ